MPTEQRVKMGNSSRLDAPTPFPVPLRVSGFRSAASWRGYRNNNETNAIASGTTGIEREPLSGILFASLSPLYSVVCGYERPVKPPGLSAQSYVLRLRGEAADTPDCLLTATIYAGTFRRLGLRVPSGTLNCGRIVRFDENVHWSLIPATELALRCRGGTRCRGHF
jgi:hypothetical protein